MGLKLTLDVDLFAQFRHEFDIKSKKNDFYLRVSRLLQSQWLMIESLVQR